MSHFVEALKRVMDKNGIKQKDFVEKSDLIPSHVSQIIREIQTTVHPEDMAKLAEIASSEKIEQAEIIRAYLRDYLPQIPASKLIDISLTNHNGSMLKDQPVDFGPTRLAPELEEAFKRLYSRCATDKNMRGLILSLSKLKLDTANKA